MNSLRQNELAIGRLSVKSERADGLKFRLGFERLFGGANFLPAGLPPHAVVCIKKIRDPQPRTLNLHRAENQSSEAWRNSVRREIEKLYRRAARPIRETVPAQAESVVFNDRAELLACLAMDWQHGWLAENWWWRGLFPNLGQAQTVVRIWLESAEYAPTALQLLAKEQTAASFAARLQPNEAEDLLRRIVAVFGLDKIQKILFESIEKSEKLPNESRASSIEWQNAPAPNDVFDEIQKLAPWFKFVSETRRISSNLPGQSLLGIGLMLSRAPQIVRSNEFARQLKIFQIEVKKYQGTAAKNLFQTFAPPEKTSETVHLIRNIKREERNAQNRASNLSDTRRGAEKNSETKKQQDFENLGGFREITPPKSKRGARKTAEKSDEFFSPKSQPEEKPEARRVKSGTKSRRKKEATIRAIEFSETVEAVEEFYELIIETRFGGVFYLLNLGLYLNLYRDFTETGAAEIDLNIWDFIALVGLAFVGEKFKDDAVWSFLKRLAGRETDEDFGENFAAPGEWRIAAQWLDTFQIGEKWFWATDGKRLVVRHPEIFSVIDVRRRGDLENQLKNELKIYEKDSSEITETEFKDFPATFLQRLIEFIERRLRQALNLSPDEPLAEILFARRATATATATHLDVTFRLADLPLAVRLSGLDRDAGWIPAAGKFVKFHFI